MFKYARILSRYAANKRINYPVAGMIGGACVGVAAIASDPNARKAIMGLYRGIFLNQRPPNHNSFNLQNRAELNANLNQIDGDHVYKRMVKSTNEWMDHFNFELPDSLRDKIGYSVEQVVKGRRSLSQAHLTEAIGFLCNIPGSNIKGALLVGFFANMWGGALVTGAAEDPLNMGVGGDPFETV